MKIHYSKIVSLSTLLLMACYAHGPEFATDTDIVFTNYNPEFAFKSKTTFAIPDKIVKITGDVVTGDPPQFVGDAVSASIISQITKDMVALGYTKVDISQSPGLILAPAALESTTIVYWYDYWGWYWGGYYPGWGYPYYPYYPSYSSYSTGTLIMTLIDPTVTSGDDHPVAQWRGVISGLLTYSYDASRVNPLIDQAFTQSPYLKK